MQRFLAVTPEQAREAARPGYTLAHVAYCIGPGSTLLRQALPLRTRGGAMSISDRDAPTVEAPEELCAAVLRECGRWGYTGVVLDWEEAPRGDLIALIRRLAPPLHSQRRALYLPESYAQAMEDGTTLLVCTAISGGSLREHLLETARACGGAQRLALDVQRLRMDFTLPARSGEGCPLSAEELHRSMEGRSVFFSPELCARYFTYTQHQTLHFVLFDDADTIAQKLRLGQELGVSAAFLMWPEVRDIAADLP